MYLSTAVETGGPDTRVGKFLITSVFSADLGRDIWKKKYPNVVVEK